MAIALGLAASVFPLAAVARAPAVHGPPPAVADPCARVPPAVAAAVARERGWRLLRLVDLDVEDDRRLWNAVRPTACPGFASAHLGVGSGRAFAVALVRGTPRRLEEKVILLIPRGAVFTQRVLVEPRTTARAAVVWRSPPGPTRSWDRGPTFKVAHDSIIVEVLESAATQYLFVRGRLRTVVTSD